MDFENVFQWPNKIFSAPPDLLRMSQSVHTFVRCSLSPPGDTDDNFPVPVGSVFRPPGRSVVRVKCKAVFHVLFYFRFNSGLMRRSRQEACNDVQKEYYIMSMAMLCKCPTVAQEIAVQYCELHCLPHQFLLSTVTPHWFWSRAQRDHCDWAGDEQCSAFLCPLCVGYVREP